MVKKVFGICSWPENQGEEIEILDVQLDETDEEAIIRAKDLYSHDLECIIKEVPK